MREIETRLYDIMCELFIGGEKRIIEFDSIDEWARQSFDTPKTREQSTKEWLCRELAVLSNSLSEPLTEQEKNEITIAIYIRVFDIVSAVYQKRIDYLKKVLFTYDTDY